MKEYQNLISAVVVAAAIVAAALILKSGNGRYQACPIDRSGAVAVIDTGTGTAKLAAP